MKDLIVDHEEIIYSNKVHLPQRHYKINILAYKRFACRNRVYFH